MPWKSLSNFECDTWSLVLVPLRVTYFLWKLHIKISLSFRSNRWSTLLGTVTKFDSEGFGTLVREWVKWKCVIFSVSFSNFYQICSGIRGFLKVKSLIRLSGYFSSLCCDPAYDDMEFSSVGGCYCSHFERGGCDVILTCFVLITRFCYFQSPNTAAAQAAQAGLKVESAALADNWDDAEGYYRKYETIFRDELCMVCLWRKLASLFTSVEPWTCT